MRRKALPPLPEFMDHIPEDRMPLWDIILGTRGPVTYKIRVRAYCKVRALEIVKAHLNSLMTNDNIEHPGWFSGKLSSGHHNPNIVLHCIRWCIDLITSMDCYSVNLEELKRIEEERERRKMDTSTSTDLERKKEKERNIRFKKKRVKNKKRKTLKRRRYPED